MKMLFGSIMSVIFIFIIGCSGNQPITPDTLKSVAGDFKPQVMVSDWDSEGNPLEGSGILGAFQVKVNLENLSGELIPIRQNQSQDVLEIVDITNFLTLAPCTDCVHLNSIRMDTDNRLILNIGVKHPFATPNPEEPITGKNRADLHVFNVEGTVIFKDDPSSVLTFSILGQKIKPVTLVNADGYSPYLDGSIDSFMPTEATLHPYILHFDDFTNGNFSPSSPYGFTDILHPTGNLVMAMGSETDFKDYIFDIDESSTGIEFILAIGCTYGISADNRNQRFSPVYRLPQFNKKAASCVWVDEIIEDGMLGFMPGDTNSSETIVLKVLDMNQGYKLGDGLDNLRHLSNVQEIDIEMPSILNSIKILNNPIPTGGNPRNPSNPLSFSITVKNELGAPVGEYPCLIKVLDSYPPGINEAVSGDGISRVAPTQQPTEGLFQIAEFATYTPFIAKVEFHNTEPVASFERTPTGDPQVDLPVRLDASNSSDPDGDNLTYEWDFDYQINDFQVEGTGSVIYHPYTVTGTYEIALRVTDDGLPPMSDIITQSITIRASEVLAFSPNQSLFGPVGPSHPGEATTLFDGCPLGMHYADAKNSKLYAIVPSGSPPPSPLNLYCIRSDNSGSSFVLPQTIVNDSNLPSSVPNSSISLTLSNKADVAWSIPGLPGVVYHDRANVDYGFGSDGIVYDSSWLGINMSHDTFDDNEIYITYSHLDLSAGFIYRIVLFRSFNNGNSFNDNPIDVAYKASCGTTGNYFTSQVALDETGTIHVAFIAGTSTSNPGQIRYTKSEDHGDTFTQYVPLQILQGVSSLWDYKSLSLDTHPDGQNIYIAYRSQDAGINNIYLLRSTDGGTNFESPVLVDNRPNNCDMPCVVADNYGWVYVSYEDRVDEVAPVHYDVRVSRSRDGGISFEPSVLVNWDDPAPTPGQHQVAPCITVDESLNVHVFWRDDRDAPYVDFRLYYAKATQ